MSGIESGAKILKELEKVSKKLKPFKPEIKSFRINYIEKNSEIKYFLLIPRGVRRRIRKKVEIPIASGFWVDEMWDLDKLEKVNFSWEFKNNKWTLLVNRLPSSERYWLTLKGNVSPSFLDRLVNVKAAENPSRKKGDDVYWMHSALKDVSILEKIWSELNIDQVSADIRIGVERFFTSAIPNAIKHRLQLTKELLDAIGRGDRQREQKLKYRYRLSRTQTPISPQEIYNLILRLVSGDFFSSYVRVDDPFRLGSIEPTQHFAVLIPKKVKVGVHTDLSFKMPVAKGNLSFKRKKYIDSVSDAILKILPKKSKTSKK